MTADQFLQQTLFLCNLSVFNIERTEHYRELWTTNEHPEFTGYGLLQLLMIMESKGFNFQFTGMDTLKIIAPHYEFHKKEKETLIDGWSCILGPGVNGCETRD